MLYFLLLFAVLLVPFKIRFWADTEKDAIIIQAEFMLPFNSGIKFFKRSITAKSVITSLFSRKNPKKHKAPIFNIIKKHAKIKKLNLLLKIGTGDASSTALLSGQALGLLTPYALSLSKGKSNIEVVPDFEKSNFFLQGECIFSFTLTKIIIIFAKIKFSGGKKKWKSIRLKT